MVAMNNVRRKAYRRRGMPSHFSFWLLIASTIFLLSSVASTSSPTTPRVTSLIHTNSREDHILPKRHNHQQHWQKRQDTIPTANRNLAHRQRKTSVAARIDYIDMKDRGGSSGTQGNNKRMPQRVRIVPFDLFIAPTPVQLQRGDEDLLLIELQELVALFIQSQLQQNRDEYGGIAARYGPETTVEYVLFSDIETNSWTAGVKGREDTAHTTLTFNGGVASFLGHHTPSTDAVNQWVQIAINDLFVPALQETHYEYVQTTKYVEIGSQEIYEYNPPPLAEQPSESASLEYQLSQNSEGPRNDDLSLEDITIITAIAIVVVLIAMVLWVRHNNRAVRILCLSNKDKEETIDFSDQAPLSLSHHDGIPDVDDDSIKRYKRRKAKSVKGLKRKVVTPATKYDVDDDDDDDIRVNELAQELSHAGSVAAQCNAEEASLHSGVSDFTIPTVSGASFSSAASRFRGLSFSSHNPFKKGLMPQESFQKDRFTNLSKDMMFSSWAGKGPNLDLLHGTGRGETVLKPSYFSAAEERAADTNPISSSSRSNSEEKNSQSSEQDSGAQAFLFEQAHENEERKSSGQDNDLSTSPRRSRKKGMPPRPEGSGSKRASADLV